LGGDIAYLFETTEVDVFNVFSIGPLVGFSHFFRDNDNVDFSFIPIAASGRYNFTDEFFAGADLGFAIGVDKGNDGGFYYRPKLGYYFGNLALIASYSGIEVDGGSFDSLNLGFEVGF
jgi:hypothetical protein